MVKNEHWKLDGSIYIDDKEFVLAVATNDGGVLTHASKHLQTDKDIVLAAAHNNGYTALSCASKKQCADKNIVLVAATNNGNALQLASESLRADKDVVLAAATNNGFALEYASENLRADKDVALAAATSYGKALRYASENLRADKDVVLAATTNDGGALEYASENLQADKDVVLAAATNHGYAALIYGSRNLRSDKDVVLAAAINYSCALEYASHDLLDCTINDNLHFIGTVIRASFVFKLRDFPGLKGTLATLYLKLRAIVHQGNGNLQLDCCADASPQVVAKQWLACLFETQWCLVQACKNGLASDDIQHHICEFSGLASDIQTVDQLQTYTPTICAVLERSSGVSWLGLLEELASENDSESDSGNDSESDSDDDWESDSGNDSESDSGNDSDIDLVGSDSE